MVEFRTRAPGDLGGGEETEGSLDKHIDRVFENIKNNPEIKLNIYQSLKEQGVNPAVIQAVFPEAQKFEQMQAQAQAAEAAQTVESTVEDTNENPEPTVKTVTQEPTPEQLLDFVDDIIDLHPKDEEATLGDLKNFGENNPDILENAISIAFSQDNE